ncbi:MAG: hypothetical protein V2A73_08690 [Pseudomonadota bacterium]
MARVASYARYYRLDAETSRMLDRLVAEDGLPETEVFRRLVRAEAERRGYVEITTTEPAAVVLSV